MFKLITVISFSFILTLSFLTPSMIMLIDDDSIITTENLNEKKNKNDKEKEVEDSENDENENGNEKKEVFFSNPNNPNTSFNSNNSLASTSYIEAAFIHSLEVQLPPPEHII